MKAKYILRGLGLGMIITAVVMGAYTKNAVADARVAVLKEYGIGEEAALAETLVDVGGSKEDDITPPESVSVTAPAAVEGSVPVTVPYNEEQEPEVQSVSDTAQATEQSGQEAVPDDGLESGQEAVSASATLAGEQSGTVTIEISKGDDSGTVARKLYNAGLVESAAEYDAFLMQHGYDKKLSTGTKTIDVTDSWQDIADKLSKK